MFQQLFCTFALIRIFTKTTIYKVGELIATLFEFWWLSVHNTLHSLLMLHSQKRRLPFGQLYRHHSQRPNVDFFFIWLLLDQLWCHPGRSTYQGLPIHDFFCQLNRKTKVSYFHFPFQAQQHIVALQVSMKLPSGMKRVKSLEHFAKNIGDNSFWHFFEIIVDEIDHCPSIHKLHKHEQRLLIVVSEEMACEVIRIAQIHHSYFSSNFFESAFIFELYYSASIITSVRWLPVISKENLAHGSLSQLFLKDEVFGGRLLNEMHILDHLLKLTCGQKFQLNVTLHHFRLIILRSMLLLVGIGVVEFLRQLFREVFQFTIFACLHVQTVLYSGWTRQCCVYSENSMGMELIKLRIDSGSSYQARTGQGRFSVLVSLLQSILQGSSQFLAHYLGTPSRRSVTLFLTIFMPPGRRIGLPESSFFCSSGVSVGELLPNPIDYQNFVQHALQYKRPSCQICIFFLIQRFTDLSYRNPRLSFVDFHCLQPLETCSF